MMENDGKIPIPEVPIPKEVYGIPSIFQSWFPIPKIVEIPISTPKVSIPSNPDPEIFWNPDPVEP
jgi:hypothetical protein